MAGIKIQLSTDEAKAASDRLHQSLNRLGAQAVLTEKEINDLEKRMTNKLQAEGTVRVLADLKNMTGLTGKEMESLKIQLGGQIGTIDRLKNAYTGLKDHWMAITGVMMAGVMALAKTWEYVQLGAEVQKVEVAYEAMAESAEMNGKRLSAGMVMAVHGVMDQSDLMKKATFAISQEVVKSESEMIQLAGASRILALQSGKDVQEVYEAIVQGIVTQMPRGMKSVGAITKEQMNIVNKAFALGITEVNLFKMAMANAEVAAAKLSETNIRAAESVGQFKAQLHGMKEVAGGTLLQVFQALFGVMQEVAAVFMLTGSAVSITASGLVKLSAVTTINPKLKESLNEQAKEYRELAKEQLSYARSLATGGVGNVLSLFGEENPFEQKEARIPKELRKEAAEAGLELEMQAARALIREGQTKKETAEMMKDVDAQTTKQMELQYKSRSEIASKYGMGDVYNESINIEAKKSLNAKYYSDRMRQIQAELEAKKATDKEFKDDPEAAGHFLETEKKKLDAEMATRGVEIATDRARLEILKQIEAQKEKEILLEGMYAREVETMKSRYEVALVYNSAEKNATLGELDRLKRINDLRDQAGLLTPVMKIENDYEDQKNRFLVERVDIMKQMEEQAKMATPMEMMGEGSGKEMLEQVLKFKQVETDIANLEKDRQKAIAVATIEMHKQLALGNLDRQKVLSSLEERYGTVTPQMKVGLDYEDQRNRLLLDQQAIKENIDALNEDDSPEGKKGLLDLLLKQNQSEQNLAALEERRALAMKEYSGSWQEGVVSGLRNFRNSLGSEFQIWEQFAKDSAEGMRTAFSDFFFDALGGEMKSFSDYWQSFANSLRRALADALSKDFASDLMSGLKGGASGGGSWIGSLFGMVGGLFGMGGESALYRMGGEAMGGYYVAKGDAFYQGNVIPFRAGGVIDRPTFFPMAKGTGIMGESGPEAVMPLARNSSGQLGVKASGGNSLSIVVPININGQASGKMQSELRTEIEATVEKVVRRHM